MRVNERWRYSICGYIGHFGENFSSSRRSILHSMYAVIACDPRARNVQKGRAKRTCKKDVRYGPAVSLVALPHSAYSYYRYIAAQMAAFGLQAPADAGVHFDGAQSVIAAQLVIAAQYAQHRG